MAAKTRAAGRCEACGRAFAVWKTADGSVAPIGCGDGCPCGGTAFRILAGADTAG